MASHLLLALSRQSPLPETHWRALGDLPGASVSERFVSAPEGAAHRMFLPCQEVGLHRFTDAGSAQRARDHLLQDERSGEPGSITCWKHSWRCESPLLPSGQGSAVFAVLAQPKRGREAEYEDWYRQRHVHDMLDVRGFVACDRYRILESSGETDFHFFTVYEIRTNNLAETMAEEVRHIGSERIVWSDAKDNSTTRVLVLTPRLRCCP